MTYLYHTHQLGLGVITFMITEVRDGVQSMVLPIGNGLYD